MEHQEPSRYRPYYNPTPATYVSARPSYIQETDLPSSTYDLIENTPVPTKEALLGLLNLYTIEYIGVLLAQPFENAKILLQCQNIPKGLLPNVKRDRDQTASDDNDDDEDPDYFTDTATPITAERRATDRTGYVLQHEPDESTRPPWQIAPSLPTSLNNIMSTIYSAEGATGVWKGANITFIYNILKESLEGWLSGTMSVLIGIPDPALMLETGDPASIAVTLASVGLTAILLAPIDIARTKIILTPISEPRGMLFTLKSLPSKICPASLLIPTLLHSMVPSLLSVSLSSLFDPLASLIQLFVKLPLETILHRAQMYCAPPVKTVVNLGQYTGVFGTPWWITRQEEDGIFGLYRGWKAGVWGVVGVWSLESIEKLPYLSYSTTDIHGIARDHHLGFSASPIGWRALMRNQSKAGVVKDVTQAPVSDHYEYPEGGYGWVVLLASAAFFQCGWGLSNAWGVFQAYYEQTFVGTSTSVISLIGSIQAAMIEGTGLIAGLLVDKYGARKVCIGGGLLQIIALLATSFCKTVWQLYLAQGFLFGVGAGSCYIAAVSVPGQWFHKKKATAYGTLYLSSGLGGVIWPIAVAKLLPSVGYGWTVRIVMFIALVEIIFGCIFLKERQIGPERPVYIAGVDKGPNIYKDPKLWICAFGFFLSSLGFFNPFFFITTFATSIGMSNRLAFYQLAILNAASLPGRVIIGVLADRYGRLNLLILSLLTGALLQLTFWPFVRSNAMVVLFASMYGFAFGGMISLYPAVTSQVCGAEKLASKFGVVSFVGGMGGLLGPPIAGLWIRRTPESYLGAILFGGGFMLFSCIWVICQRLWLSRKILIFL